MRLERIESLSELKHGDRIHLTIGAYHLKDVIVALSSTRPHLVFFCQSVYGGLDGGHRVEADSVGRRYGWSVGTLNQPRYYGIRGLRRLLSRQRQVGAT